MAVSLADARRRIAGVAPSATPRQQSARRFSVLKESSGSDRRDIVREIIEIVTDVARGLAPGGQDPFEDQLPGGRR